jgi:alpha/beta hydrolase fold
MVVAVGYRLAPESRYPAAFDDGVNVLKWLGKQSNLASIVSTRGVAGGGGNAGRILNGTDTFGTASVEPWLAAHADLSRFSFFLSYLSFYSYWRAYILFFF